MVESKVDKERSGAPAVLPDRRESEEITPESNEFAALNLILPDEAAPLSLPGYETIARIREKTNEFRKGYQNWRLHGAKGARGEAKDLFERKQRKGDATAKTRVDFQRRASREDFADEQLIDDKDAAAAGGGGAAAVGAAPTTPHHFANEEDWLRFYFSPHTPLLSLDEARKKSLLLPICQANLPRIKKLSEANRWHELKIPGYNRDASTVDCWIMHIGVGGFHRSHQAVYLDELLTAQARARESLHATGGSSSPKAGGGGGGGESAESLAKDPKWGLCGVGLMPFDTKMRDALRNQDYLYTVLTRSSTSNAARVVGSMMDYVYVPDQPERAIQRVSDPRTKIVSLTVTEKGYCQATDGGLDFQNPLIQHDLKDLSCPSSAIGFITAGLIRRRDANQVPFTVMACDNLPENGIVARRMVLDFAGRYDPSGALKEWVEENVCFPSSMVDRITPQTGPEHRDILAQDFLLLDEWPVVAEEFRQWVIEDKFSCGRPRFEHVGAMFVKDVHSYELMKLRLLNGGHGVLAYLGYLLGYRFVDDAVADVLVSSFLRSYMDEVTPTVKNVRIEIERYKEKIVERFGNRFIKDKIARIAEDGSTKFYNTMRESVMELCDRGLHIHHCSLGLAGWMRYMAAEDEQGDPIELKDPKSGALSKLAKDALSKPNNARCITEFLRNAFGDEFVSIDRIVTEVTLSFYALKKIGSKETLKSGGPLHALLRNRLTGDPQDTLTQLLQFSGV